MRMLWSGLGPLLLWGAVGILAGAAVGPVGSFAESTIGSMGTRSGTLRCRYTIRDIGFVDLSGPTYRLQLEGALERRFSATQAQALDDLRRESNVIGQATVLESEEAMRWTLQAEGRKSLTLCAPSASDLRVEAALARALHSPLRDAIAAEALSTFAFIVVFEGADAARNQHVAELVDEIEVGLQQLESQLPRPIDRPVRRLTVSHADRAVEDVLLWSLGYEERWAADVGIAILYGRGKLAAAARFGPEISAAPLLAQLALIGQSCECDTDRDWVAEVNIPMAWTDRHRRSSLDALGFDPESPMVKAEVVRILRKEGSGRRDANSADSTAAIAFGYRETDLGREAAAPPERAFTTDGSDAGLGPLPTTERGLRVIEGTGDDDWGFDDGEPDMPAEAMPAGRTLSDTLPTPAGISWVALLVGGFLILSTVAAIVVVIANRRTQ